MEQKPQIPTLKDSKKPQLKIRGLASGLSLLDRVKQFKKKDLAFILAGLGVLIMAPLAEHFMMSPESGGSSSFKPGWGFSSGRFGDGSSPYEGGVNGMAPGGAANGSDLITPLNVRDPASLIMGPGAQQQPAATATTTPPAKDGADWKDALANAASKGASAATRAASLPVPKTSLTNAGLRGLGAAAGGGGGGYSLPALNAGNVPNHAAESNAMQRVIAAPGYRGAGPRGGQNASAGALEALKKAAANAGSDFNRTGPAASALEAAAGRHMPTGGGGGDSGAGGQGREDKGPGGGNDKSSKSMGESLEFMAKKDWQQKMRDLAFEKLKKQEMMWPNLKEKMAEEMVMSPVKALTGQMTDAFKKLGEGSESLIYKCKNGFSKKRSGVKDSCTGEIAKDTQFCLSGTDILSVANGTPQRPPVGIGCGLVPGDKESSSQMTEGGLGAVSGMLTDPSAQIGQGSAKALEATCASLDKITDAQYQGVKTAMKAAALGILAARNKITGEAAGGACGAIAQNQASFDSGIKSAAETMGSKVIPPLKTALAKTGGYDQGLSAVLDKAPGCSILTTPMSGAADAAKAELAQSGAAGLLAPGGEVAKSIALADGALRDAQGELRKAQTELGRANSVRDDQAQSKEADERRAHYLVISKNMGEYSMLLDGKSAQYETVKSQHAALQKAAASTELVLANAKESVKSSGKIEMIKPDANFSPDKAVSPQQHMTVAEFDAAVFQAKNPFQAGGLAPAPDPLGMNVKQAITQNKPKVLDLVEYVKGQDAAVASALDNSAAVLQPLAAGK